MSYYIWLDKNNKEIKREEKGRGRPKASSVQKEDGNFYIYEQNIEPIEPIEEALFSDNSFEKRVEEISGRPIDEVKTKVIKSHSSFSLKELLSNIHKAEKDYFEDDRVIDILRPAIIRETNIKGVKYNAVYARLKINKENKTIQIWSSYPNGDPTYSIEDLEINE